MVGMKRLFIAVELPDEIKEKVYSLAKELPEEGVKKVEQQNIHITLKFIGDFTEDKIPELESRLNSIRHNRFRCIASGAGVFPSPDYIKVVWAGVKCDGINGLASAIDDSLEGLVAKETRPFSSHATIARVKRKIDAKSFLEKHKEDVFGEFEVSEFVLMQSELSRGGPVYTVLKKFALE